MSLVLSLYRAASAALSPFAGIALDRRAAAGKEDPARTGERLGEARLARPEGPLLWMHGASVGEARLLLLILSGLRERGYEGAALLTTQTLTGARTVAAAAEDDPRLIHQMAPIDTAKATQLFVAHWRPDAFVLAEGELWPNLIRAAGEADIPRLFVNARMTAKSLKGWRRLPAAFDTLLAGFDFIGAADARTANGLEDLLGRGVDTLGNLKLTAPQKSLPETQARDAKSLKAGAFRGRPVLLAASTHDSEEALILSVFRVLRLSHPDLALILAPRHPERSDAILQLLSGFDVARRSRAEPPTPATDILFADTLGEMGLWIALSDAVYLGGGHARGVGGHDPVEAVRAGRPVVTGPLAFNFEDLLQALEKTGAVGIAAGHDALLLALEAALARGPSTADAASLAVLDGAKPAMIATLAAIERALKGRPHA